MSLTPLQMAVNAALNDYRNILGAGFRQWAGAQGLDQKRRCSWNEYGWPDQISFDDLHKLYTRQGIAYGVVNRYSGKCFETNPEVIEGGEEQDSEKESTWDKEFASFAKRFKLWKAVRQTDVRRLVGRYAGLILQIADGKDWSQPVTGAAVLKRFIPAWEGQLKVETWDLDTRSPNYGEPLMWQFDEVAVCTDGGQSAGARQFPIHPDRVIIFGDFRSGDSFLTPCYNDFVNLEKISGGSGESFLKNSARQLAINFGEKVDLNKIARMHGVELKDLQQAFNEQADDLNRGFDKLLITQNAETTALVANVPDPVPHYSVSLQNISASTGIPSKIIVGMQTGERASSEDQKDFAKLCQGRRTNELTDDIENVVNHLIRIKLLKPSPAAEGEFSVTWDDLSASSDLEKAELADKYATVNQKMAGSGEAAPFSREEIRTAAGFDNEDDAPEPLPDVQDEPLPGEPGAAA